MAWLPSRTVSSIPWQWLPSDCRWPGLGCPCYKPPRCSWCFYGLWLVDAARLKTWQWMDSCADLEISRFSSDFHHWVDLPWFITHYHTLSTETDQIRNQQSTSPCLVLGHDSAEHRGQPWIPPLYDLGVPCGPLGMIIHTAGKKKTAHL